MVTRPLPRSRWARRSLRPQRTVGSRRSSLIVTDLSTTAVWLRLLKGACDAGLEFQSITMARANPQNNFGGDAEFEDKVVNLNRAAKVVKGGRRFAFSALVVVGNRNGRVGIGTGKAREVPDAIRKATERARQNLVTVPIVDGTLPHEVLGHTGAGRVMLRPAGAGTGVIAGSSIKAVMELAGVSNVITKCIGSNNPHNMMRATFDAIAQLRSIEEVARRRGKTVEEIRG